VAEVIVVIVSHNEQHNGDAANVLGWEFTGRRPCHSPSPGQRPGNSDQPPAHNKAQRAATQPQPQRGRNSTAQGNALGNGSQQLHVSAQRANVFIQCERRGLPVDISKWKCCDGFRTPNWCPSGRK
jgi:hypothetical protein